MDFFSSTWFMQGVWHPLQTPAHLILVVALGVLIGQHGQRLRVILLVFAILLTMGFVIKQMVTFNLNKELIIVVLALISSVLIILRLTLPSTIIFLLTLLSGILLGLDSSPIFIPGMGESSRNNWLLGTSVSFYLSLTLMMLISTLLNKYWNGIILRVLGSWIATSAIFVLTLMLVKH